MNTSIPVILDALERKDSYRLRELSREYTNQAVETQSRNDLGVAIIAYSFHKILSKAHLRKKSKELVDDAQAHLRAHDIEGVIDCIDRFDKENGFFQSPLVGKAKVKLGARLYSQGLSLSKSANLAGVGVSDILEYIGETKTDIVGKAMPVRKRLDVARKLFD